MATAVQWLTYPGDATSTVGEIKGPTLDNELLTAVDAVPYRETGGKVVSTLVGFAYGARCCVCHELVDSQPPHDKISPAFRIFHRGCEDGLTK